MNSLKRLGAAVVLTFALSLSVFAGEMNTPPCTAPEPGEMNTPPCAAQTPADYSAASEQIETPPASNEINMPSVVDAVMNLLLLF